VCGRTTSRLMSLRASRCCARSWRPTGRSDRALAEYSEETAGELAILEAAAGAHAQYGPACITQYLISKAESVSDMLEVALLLKEVGLWRAAERGQGRLRTCAIMPVPLFETIADLEAAPADDGGAYFALCRRSARLRGRAAIRK
jgi:phosphoenolpyruvate carboxylase